MKLLPHALAATLLFAVSAASQARSVDICDFESDFEMRLDDQAVVFHRTAGAPLRVEMRHGRLIVDGREVALSKEDAERVARYERDVRALVPEVKAIAVDAVGLASQAILQVTTAFGGSNSERVAERIDELTSQLADRIDATDDTADWDNDEFDEAIDALVSELVPMMTGDIAAVAIKAALTGDEDGIREIEQRAERMEKAIEQNVERRADELEARAEALCPRVKALDELEASLNVRLADNHPLDLLQIND